MDGPARAICRGVLLGRDDLVLAPALALSRGQGNVQSDQDLQSLFLLPRTRSSLSVVFLAFASTARAQKIRLPSCCRRRSARSGCGHDTNVDPCAQRAPALRSLPPTWTLKSAATVTGATWRIGCLDNAGAVADVAIFQLLTFGETERSVAASRVIEVRGHYIIGLTPAARRGHGCAQAGRRGDVEARIARARRPIRCQRPKNLADLDREVRTLHVEPSGRRVYRHPPIL